MKKLLTITLALVLSLAMVACGEKPAPASPASPAAPASSAAPKATDAEEAPEKPTAEGKPDLNNPEYTEDQLAVAQKFAAMSDSFQALADTISADENLMAVQELVDTMNVLIDAVNKDDALFADPKNLTAQVLTGLEGDIEIGNTFIKEMEAMIKNYQGKKTVTIAVEIENLTGVEIHGLAMTPTNSEEWGGNLLKAPLADGATGVTKMTFTEDTMTWDLLAADSQGTELTFIGIDFSIAPTEGAVLTLAATEGGAYMASFNQ